MRSTISSGLLWLIVGAFVPVVTIVMKVQFSQECGGYLKQAADANTVELALQRIDKALAYVDEHKLTYGYTSILWRTENDNIGYWYQNVKACREELVKAKDAPSLEQTNLLLKVRESLTDQGEKGTELTLPNGISRYPFNALFAFLNTISAIMICVGGYKILVWYEEY